MAEATSDLKAHLAGEDPAVEENEVTTGRVKLKGRLSVGHLSAMQVLDFSASILTVCCSQVVPVNPLQRLDTGCLQLPRARNMGR